MKWTFFNRFNTTNSFQIKSFQDTHQLTNRRFIICQVNGQTSACQLLRNGFMQAILSQVAYVQSLMDSSLLSYISSSYGCVQEVEGLFWHVRCNTKLKKQTSINLTGYFETLTLRLDILRHLHNESCDE